MKIFYILIMLILLIIIFYNISEKFSDTCDGNCGKYNNSNNKIDTNFYNRHSLGTRLLIPCDK